jgi:hypothetical protein
MALAGEANAIERYSRTISLKIGANLRLAELLAKLLYTFPRFCYRHILSNPSATRAMGRIFSGQMAYRELPLAVWSKAIRQLSWR